MKINSKRLLQNLHTLRELTDTPGEGVTRFSYGAQDAAARAFILNRARAAGARIREDQVGNLLISSAHNRPGQKRILCGSHVDTVRNGGWLDGIYGVCSALEVLETLAEAGGRPENGSEPEPSPAAGSLNYDMIIFAEEEGSNFGSTMTGSKYIIGTYRDEDMDRLTADDGRTLRQMLAARPRAAVEEEDAAGNAAQEDPLSLPWDLSDAEAMLELHIEQGPVLDRRSLTVGIVDSIFGMRVIEVTLHGIGNHAGATPMRERNDALSAAAECVLAAERIVRSDPEERTVVTVGKMEIQPNCSNVIPETVRFTVEVRDRDEDEINGNMDRIIREIRRIADSRGVRSEIREHSKSSPLHLDARITGMIRTAAEAAGIPGLVMDSGAVHDACMIAEAGVPTGMIFVPSIDGRSHVPEEDTKEADLAAGAQLLMDVIEQLCAESA